MTKVIGKILKTILLLTIILILSLAAASFFLSNRVSNLILLTINNKISTRIDVGSVKLSLLRQFPKATVDLGNISVLSSTDLNRSDFHSINTDTLLKAERMYVSFSISDILKKKYDIEKINIHNGRIILLTDSSGTVNYRIMSGDGTNDSTRLSLVLKRIQLNSVDIVYINNPVKMKLEGKVSNARLSSRLSNGFVSLGSEADVVISYFELDKIKILTPFNAGIDLEIENSAGGLLIRKGSLSVEGISFLINGNISSDDIADLHLAADNINLSGITKYIPPVYAEKIKGFEFSGKMNIISNITGKFSRLVKPHFDLNCSLENGSVIYPTTGLKVSNLNLNASYSNGNNNNQETTIIKVSDISAKLGSADYSGNLEAANLHRPAIRLNLKGRILPSELKQFFRIDAISVASGFCDAEIHATTTWKPGDKITMHSLLNQKYNALLRFGDMTLGFKEPDITFSNIMGEIISSTGISAKDLSFEYKDQMILSNGRFSSLHEWLSVVLR